MSRVNAPSGTPPPQLRPSSDSVFSLGASNGTQDEPATKVELSISCKGLAIGDILSSDPMVVVFQRVPGNKWKEVGRTEEIRKTLNPVFTKPVPLVFAFEEVQTLNFVVIDIDDRSSHALKTLRNQDFLGECSANVHTSGHLMMMM